MFRQQRTQIELIELKRVAEYVEEEPALSPAVMLPGASYGQVQQPEGSISQICSPCSDFAIVMLGHIFLFTSHAISSWNLVAYFSDLLSHKTGKNTYDALLETYDVGLINTTQGLLKANTTSACSWIPEKNKFSSTLSVCQKLHKDIAASPLQVNDFLYFSEPNVTAFRYHPTSGFKTKNYIELINIALFATGFLMLLWTSYRQSKKEKIHKLVLFCTALSQIGLALLDSSIKASDQMTMKACTQGCNAFDYELTTNGRHFSIGHSFPDNTPLSMGLFFLAMQLSSSVALYLFCYLFYPLPKDLYSSATFQGLLNSFRAERTPVIEQNINEDDRPYFRLA